MKITISVQYQGKPMFETLDVPPSENERALPPHWKHHRKAMRLVNVLNESGAKADFLLVPESAAELQRIVSKGRMMAKRVWHTSEIKPSKAKTKAIRKWRELVA
jgi:hypothetical protein